MRSFEKLKVKIRKIRKQKVGTNKSAHINIVKEKKYLLNKFKFIDWVFKVVLTDVIKKA